VVDSNDVVLMAGMMLHGRRMVLVFAVGLLCGYTVMYIASVYQQSDATARHHFVPSAPHLHGEMDQHMRALHDVQQWHDFDENRHLSMY